MMFVVLRASGVLRGVIVVNCSEFPYCSVQGGTLDFERQYSVIVKVRGVLESYQNEKHINWESVVFVV